MAEIRKAREKDTPRRAGRAERLSSTDKEHALGSVEGESDGGMTRMVAAETEGVEERR
jgi:hypothetical protein